MTMLHEDNEPYPLEFRGLDDVTDRELKGKATSLFIHHEKCPIDEPEQARAFLEEAQFYLTELQRRRDERVARRDLWLEIAVIILIGVEIVLGYRGIVLAVQQGRRDDEQMAKQNGILNSLQASTDRTAQATVGLVTAMNIMKESAASTAATLGSLNATTKIMNNGVHDQLSLFYEPQITLIYEPSEYQVRFVNTGRAEVQISSIKIDGQEGVDQGSRMIAPNAYVSVDIRNRYTELVKQVKPGTGMSLPVQATLTNEAHKQFILSGTLLAVLQEGKMVILTQTVLIAPKT